VTLGTGTFAFGKGTDEYRGWYFNLPETRERIAVEPALGIGVVAFNAAIPEGTCSGDGSGRKYCVNPVYGNSVCGATTSSPGIPSGPKIFQIELDASSYTSRSPTGARSVTIEQQIISSSTKITDSNNALVDGKNLQSITIPAGRVSWRELRN
jgi:Tfp pilus tip-associated adhesin PilY1